MVEVEPGVKMYAYEVDGLGNKLVSRLTGGALDGSAHPRRRGCSAHHHHHHQSALSSCLAGRGLPPPHAFVRTPVPLVETPLVCPAPSLPVCPPPPSSPLPPH